MNMNKKMISRSVLTVIVFCAFLLVQTKALAASSFSYKVNFPENHIGKDVGYLHLKMEPSQEQTVTFTLVNTGDKKTSVNVAANGAKTNSNGVIEYGDNNIAVDKSLPFPFEDIVTVPKKVDLEVGEEKELAIKIKMPDTNYDGLVSGGIQLIQENQAEEQQSEGATVINEYAYVVGVMLQETDKEIAPKLELNSVKAGQANLRNTVFVNYSNTQSAYFEDMTTEVQISKKGSSAVLYEKKQAKMRMAPNTQIDFPVDMSGEKMEAGDYTARILVTGSNDIREEWTKDFKITKEDADKFNERDVGLVQKSGLNWKLIIMIIVGVFLVIAIVFGVVHTLNKNKKDKKKSKKKSNKKK